MGVASSLHGLTELSVTTQVILAAAGTFFVIHMLTKKSYRLPKGPTQLPLVGNLFSFFTSDFGSLMKKWREKYGAVMLIKVVSKRFVVINDVDALEEAFVKRGSDFSGRPFIYSMHVGSEGSKNILMTNFGDMFKFQRKITSVALRQYLTGTQLEQRCHEVLGFVISAMLEQKEAFDPHRFLNLSVFNVVHGICFGTVKDIEDPDFKRIMKMADDLNDIAAAGFLEDFLPPMRLMPTGRFKSFLSMYGEWVDYIRKAYVEHKEDFDSDNLRDLIDTIILAKQQADDDSSSTKINEEFTDTHAVQLIADVFGGGVDTSRNQLAWTLLVIATRPDVQAKLQEEVDRVVGGGVPGREHRAKLVYVEAVMLESLRLYPVAPLGVPHKTMRDTHIGGYEIPANTSVFSNQIAILHDPKHWTDPLSFTPERFLDETGTKVTSRNASWIPFSVGHRACPGESLAKLQMGYIIAGLVQRLSFSLSPDSKPDLNPEGKGLVNKPPEYKVLVESR